MFEFLALRTSLRNFSHFNKDSLGISSCEKNEEVQRAVQSRCSGMAGMLDVRLVPYRETEQSLSLVYIEGEKIVLQL